MAKTLEDKNTRLSFKQYMTIALASVALFVALWNLGTVIDYVMVLLSYLLPLFIGACLAFVLNVPMKGIERFLAFCQRKMRLKVRHTLNTYISLFATLAIIALAIMAFVNYMAPSLAESAVNIAEAAESNYPKIRGLLVRVGFDIETVESIITDFDVEKVTSFLSRYVSFSSLDVVDTVISAAGTTVSIVITVFSCLVFSVYMITGKKKLNLQARKLVYAYLPQRVADRACYIGNLFYRTFSSFISSQCMDALLLALLLFGGMLLFKLPYAGIVCVLTGLFALIPYVGAFISCALGALLILLVSPIKALIFVAVFLVIQQLEGQFIYPHLVGGSVGLPAIWTLFAALVGGEMMGLFGVVFFIPLAAVIYTLIKEGAAKRLKEKGITVESPVDSEERMKQQKQQEKQETRKKNRKEKKNAKRRKKVGYELDHVVDGVNGGEEPENEDNT